MRSTVLLHTFIPAVILCSHPATAYHLAGSAHARDNLNMNSPGCRDVEPHHQREVRDTGKPPPLMNLHARF